VATGNLLTPAALVAWAIQPNTRQPYVNSLSQIKFLLPYRKTKFHMLFVSKTSYLKSEISPVRLVSIYTPWFWNLILHFSGVDCVSKFH
jgi:hypothetical protein